jgi:hypothetical protein
MNAFNLIERERQLDGLSKHHRIAFAASCVERLLPNYTAFSRMEQWGDADLLHESLEKIWAYVQGGALSEMQFDELIEECEKIVPDTEDFSSRYTSAALDAANAVIETLSCCKDGSSHRAAEVASFARDTVDMFIQQREETNPVDADLEMNILEHPLMKREIKKQEDDLSELKNQTELTPDFVRRLRSSWSNMGLSNIDVG